MGEMVDWAGATVGKSRETAATAQPSMTFGISISLRT
jgi:hypothetical protein